jgi:hypothetical protein
MTGTVTSNGNNSYLISGFAEAAYTQSLPTPVATQYSEIPGLGSMRLVGDSYQMMANAVFQPPVEKPNPVFLSLGCTFSATTLSGGCFTIPTDGSPSQTVQASLVAN